MRRFPGFAALVSALVVVALLAVPSRARAQYHGGVHVSVGVGFGFGYPGFGFGVGFGFGWYPFYNPWYPYFRYPYRYGWYPPYAYYPYPYYGYPYYPYYPYGYGTVDMLTASLRLEVKPNDADVYVDGYLAGKVSNFDGMWQRLRVQPGDHELVLYRDGYRTVKQHLYLGPNSDQRVQFAMERLAPGETADPPPSPEQPTSPMSQEPQPGQPPPGQPPPGQPMPGQPPPGYGRGTPPYQPPPNEPPPGRGGQPPPEVEVQGPVSGSFGSLALNVQPPDAQILVDGNAWPVPPGETHLLIRLPEGKHHVEIRKEGFDSYVEDVGIQRGRTLSLNVSLIRHGGGR